MSQKVYRHYSSHYLIKLIIYFFISLVKAKCNKLKKFMTEYADIIKIHNSNDKCIKIKRNQQNENSII